MSLNVNYDGTNILSLSGSANYKLLTNGKMMDDDVLIQYTSVPIAETTATASDVFAPKYFFNASGVKTQGTATPAYTLLANQDFAVSTTSTSQRAVGTISVGPSAYTAAAIIYVKVRDKAGHRTQHFIGADSFALNCWPVANPGQALQQFAHLIHRYTTANLPQTVAFHQAASDYGYGVYASQIASDGTVTISSRYSSNYSLVIDGTYNVQVYSIPYAPTQGNPYNYSF